MKKLIQNLVYPDVVEITSQEQMNKIMTELSNEALNDNFAKPLSPAGLY